MLTVSKEDIEKQTREFYKAYKSASLAIVEADFIKNMMSKTPDNHTYPYTVRVPKDVYSMLRGDFEPACEFTITEPMIGEYGPMWIGDTTDEIHIPAGYINGDSSSLFEGGLGDKFVHGLMAGSTGSGKSVALNAIIFGSCYKYPPWALHYTLSDGKVLEFKNIAMTTPLPHIEAVAATGDADYLISVLECKVNEMEATEKMFPIASKHFGKTIRNIMDFNEVTGLTLHRNLMVFDEFQAMFMNAGRKADKIAKMLDLLGRKGRATGFHLYMCSQEIGSDIPKGLLKNVTFRACLGAFPEVSQAVIGNEAASANMGQKGKLIINENVTRGDKADNINISVPFCNDASVKDIYKSTKEQADKIGFSQPMRFYDETAVRHEKEFEVFVNSFDTSDRIVMGDPAYMIRSEEQAVFIPFGTNSIENVLAISKDDVDLRRTAQTFLYSITRQNALNIGIAPESQMNALLKPHLGGLLFDDRSYDSTCFALLHKTVYQRKLLLDIDKKVFNGAIESGFDELWDSSSVASKLPASKILKQRYFAFIAFISDDPAYSKEIGGMSEDACDAYFTELYNVWENLECQNKQIQASQFKKIYVWITSADRIIGFGTDSSSKNLAQFRKILLDCCLVNVRVLMFTTNMMEFSDLKSGFLWYVMDRPSQRDVRRIGCDVMPESMLDTLAALWNSSRGDDLQKYKKMYFDGEI